MRSMLQDVRYALRQLRKSPGYALTAILTLAIGIGAHAAIFTLIDDAMLRSLPVRRPGELVTVGYRGPKMRQIAPVQSLAGLDQLRTQLKSVQQLSGWSPDMLSVPDDQGALRSIAGEMVTGDALNMLGLRPYLGRLLSPADDVPGGSQGGWPAVLGYGFWQANFHGDPGVIGRVITVSGRPVTIVGVLPRDYEGIALGQSQAAHEIAFNDVGDGYFATMHTGLLAGREFTAADRDRSTCVLNQAAAKLLVPGGSPLDQSLKASNARAHISVTCRVVGIVEDARYASLRDPAPPTLYLPAGAADFPEGGYTNNLVFMIRSGTVAQASAAYRTVLGRYAPKTGYMAFLPLTDQVNLAYAVAASAVLLIALLATLLPARAAAHCEPMQALRTE